MTRDDYSIDCPACCPDRVGFEQPSGASHLCPVCKGVGRYYFEGQVPVKLVRDILITQSEAEHAVSMATMGRELCRDLNMQVDLVSARIDKILLKIQHRARWGRYEMRPQ